MIDFADMSKIWSEARASFWSRTGRLARDAKSPLELLGLLKLERVLEKDRGAAFREEMRPLRIAIVGGVTPGPIVDLLRAALFARRARVEIFCGGFDQASAEIRDPTSELARFAPEVVVLFPSPRQAVPPSVIDSRENALAAAGEAAAETVEIATLASVRLNATVIVANHALPPGRDPGSSRSRNVSNPWGFVRAINSYLSERLPENILVCDVEFLSAKIGLDRAADPSRMYASKQLGSPELQLECARELAHLASLPWNPIKKVLVLDLDNTLWGGVIGDDGVAGVELGDVSPRGEAFKSFQKYLKTLGERGILLALCSKNTESIALEAIASHPDMVLRREDFAAIRVNWNPKPDNIRSIAEELNLGLDSFVFADDNPFETEIVRESLPMVETILLDGEPAQFLAELQDARFFEGLALTKEDTLRSRQYREESQRRELKETVTDLPSYLRSLRMKGQCNAWGSADLARVSQLINKSNQFNLTTRRRSEAELGRWVGSDDGIGISLRIQDRFGDYGLIAALLLIRDGRDLRIDTWVMSCRVLGREVERHTLDEIVRMAQRLGCDAIVGEFVPTPKNGIVRDLYLRLGFVPAGPGTETGSEFYRMIVTDWVGAPAWIEIERDVFADVPK